MRAEKTPEGCSGLSQSGIMLDSGNITDHSGDPMRSLQLQKPTTVEPTSSQITPSLPHPQKSEMITRKPNRTTRCPLKRKGSGMTITLLLFSFFGSVLGVGLPCVPNDSFCTWHFGYEPGPYNFAYQCFRAQVLVDDVCDYTTKMIWSYTAGGNSNVNLQPRPFEEIFKPCCGRDRRTGMNEYFFTFKNGSPTVAQVKVGTATSLWFLKWEVVNNDRLKFTVTDASIFNQCGLYWGPTYICEWGESNFRFYDGGGTFLGSLNIWVDLTHACIQNFPIVQQWGGGVPFTITFDPCGEPIYVGTFPLHDFHYNKCAREVGYPDYCGSWANGDYYYRDGGQNDIDQWDFRLNGTHVELWHKNLRPHPNLMQHDIKIKSMNPKQGTVFYYERNYTGQGGQTAELFYTQANDPCASTVIMPFNNISDPQIVDWKSTVLIDLGVYDTVSSCKWAYCNLQLRMTLNDTLTAPSKLGLSFVTGPNGKPNWFKINPTDPGYKNVYMRITIDATFDRAVGVGPLPGFGPFGKTPQQVQFNLVIGDPCEKTVLSLPTTLQTFTIYPNNTAFTQNFLPATNSKQVLYPTATNLCGSYVYTIVETVPKAFVTFSCGGNPCTLTAQTNQQAHAGKYPTITLKVTLNSYPKIPAATAVIYDAIVYHICLTTVISETTIPQPLSVQQDCCATFPKQITTFPMNTDTVGVSNANPMFCTAKNYTFDVTWLDVPLPTTTTASLRLTSNTLSAVGTFTITMNITFQQVGFQVITKQQTFTITVLHPCKITLLTSSQTIATINWLWGETTATDKVFTAFADSQATGYATPSLCANVYSVSPTATATKYGVSVFSATRTISVLSTDATTQGTTTTAITLSANSSTLQQTTASSQISLTVRIICVRAIAQKAAQADVEYWLNDPAKSVTLQGYNLTPSTCPNSLTYELKQKDGTALPAEITFDATVGSEKISVYSTDPLNTKTYEVLVTVTDPLSTKTLATGFKVIMYCSKRIDIISGAGIANFSYRISLDSPWYFQSSSRSTYGPFPSVCVDQGTYSYEMVYTGTGTALEYITFDSTFVNVNVVVPAFDGLYTQKFEGSYSYKIVVTDSNLQLKNELNTFTVTILTPTLLTGLTLDKSTVIPEQVCYVEECGGRLLLDLPTFNRVPADANAKLTWSFTVTHQKAGFQALNTIVPGPPSKVRIWGDAAAYAGIYILELAQTDQYTSISGKTSFKLTVHCVREINLGKRVPDQKYWINDPALIVEIPEYSVMPENCPADLVFTAKLVNDDPLPSFLLLKKTGSMHSVIVDSQNPSNLGTYQIRITATLPETGMYNDKLVIQISVLCTKKILRITSLPQVINYTINISSARAISLPIPTYEPFPKVCPPLKLSYKILTELDNDKPTFISNPVLGYIDIVSQSKDDSGIHKLKLVATDKETELINENEFELQMMAVIMITKIPKIENQVYKITDPPTEMYVPLQTPLVSPSLAIPWFTYSLVKPQPSGVMIVNQVGDVGGIIIRTNDFSKAGIYLITVGYFEECGQLEATKKFKLTLKCAEKIVSVSTVPLQRYEQGDEKKEISVPRFQIAPKGCPIQYTYSALKKDGEKLPGYIALNQETQGDEFFTVFVNNTAVELLSIDVWVYDPVSNVTSDIVNFYLSIEKDGFAATEPLLSGSAKTGNSTEKVEYKDQAQEYKDPDQVTRGPFAGVSPIVQQMLKNAGINVEPPIQIQQLKQYLVNSTVPFGTYAIRDGGDPKVDCSPDKVQLNSENTTTTIWFDFLHQVQLKSGNENTLKRRLKIKLIKADFSAPTEFNYTVQVLDKSLRVDVNFTDPGTISAVSGENDKLEVNFLDTSDIFWCPDLEKKGRVLTPFMPGKLSVLIKLPAFIATTLDVITDSIVNAGSSPTKRTGILATSMFLSYAANLAANLAWGGINSLQILSMIAIFNVIVPPNSLKLVKVIQTLVTFDLIYDIFDPTEKMGFTESPQFSENFCTLDYCSHNFLDSIGSMIVFLILAIIWEFLKVILFKQKDKQWVQNPKLKRVRTWLYSLETTGPERWATFIRFMLENYLSIIMAVMLSLNAPSVFKQEKLKMLTQDKIDFGIGQVFTVSIVFFSLLIVYVSLVDLRIKIKVEESQLHIRHIEERILHYEEMLEISPEKSALKPPVQNDIEQANQQPAEPENDREQEEPLQQEEQVEPIKQEQEPKRHEEQQEPMREEEQKEEQADIQSQEAKEEGAKIANNEPEIKEQKVEVDSAIQNDRTQNVDMDEIQSLLAQIEETIGKGPATYILEVDCNEGNPIASEQATEEANKSPVNAKPVYNDKEANDLIAEYESWGFTVDKEEKPLPDPWESRKAREKVRAKQRKNKPGPAWYELFKLKPKKVTKMDQIKRLTLTQKELWEQGIPISQTVLNENDSSLSQQPGKDKVNQADLLQDSFELRQENQKGTRAPIEEDEIDIIDTRSKPVHVSDQMIPEGLLAKEIQAKEQAQGKAIGKRQSKRMMAAIREHEEYNRVLRQNLKDLENQELELAPFGPEMLDPIHSDIYLDLKREQVLYHALLNEPFNWQDDGNESESSEEEDDELHDVPIEEKKGSEHNQRGEPFIDGWHASGVENRKEGEPLDQEQPVIEVIETETVPVQQPIEVAAEPNEFEQREAEEEAKQQMEKEQYRLKMRTANLKRYDRLTTRRKALLLEVKELELKVTRLYLNLDNYNALREDMDPNYISLLFHVNFMFRRVAMALIAFLLPDYPMLQLILFTLIGLFTTLYIATAKPFYEWYQDKIELFNEFAILLVCDVYASIMGYVYWKEDEIKYGYFLNSLIFTLLVGNLGAMTAVTTHNNWSALKNYYHLIKTRVALMLQKQEVMQRNQVESRQDVLPVISPKNPQQAIQEESKVVEQQPDLENSLRQLIDRKVVLSKPPVSLDNKLQKRLERKEKRKQAKFEKNKQMTLKEIDQIIEGLSKIQQELNN